MTQAFAAMAAIFLMVGAIWFYAPRPVQSTRSLPYHGGTTPLYAPDTSFQYVLDDPGLPAGYCWQVRYERVITSQAIKKPAGFDRMPKWKGLEKADQWGTTTQRERDTDMEVSP